jgi:DNA-binding Xre family transcriptional regulator
MGEQNSRNLPIHLRAEWQLPLRQGSNAPSCELGDSVFPRGDCAGSEPESLSGNTGATLLWVEVHENVFFEHDAGYNMLKNEMEYSTEQVAYANAMQTQTTTMGERIRQLRLARGWSQGQLAERVGVTGGAISHWESGLTKNIKLETFLRLCEELGTVPHYLIFGPGKHSPQGRRQA